MALAHGLNANLVRKWLMGRGLKRAGLAVPSGAEGLAVAKVADDAAKGALAPVMQFVPVGLAAAGSGHDPSVALGSPAPGEAPQIQVELRRGNASMTVRWPASQAQGCAAWLSELAGALLDGRGRP